MDVSTSRSLRIAPWLSRAGHSLARFSGKLSEEKPSARAMGAAHWVLREIHLSETDLTARLMRGEATQVVRDKMLFLIRFFKEAGDAAVAQDRPEEGHDLLLRGLELRVGTYWGEEPSEHADFAPPVEAFTGALAGTTIPPRTQAMLMHPYERTGAFAKAEDALYALLEAAPDACTGPYAGLVFRFNQRTAVV